MLRALLALFISAGMTGWCFFWFPLIPQCKNGTIYFRMISMNVLSEDGLSHVYHIKPLACGSEGLVGRLTIHMIRESPAFGSLILSVLIGKVLRPLPYSGSNQRRSAVEGDGLAEMQVGVGGSFLGAGNGDSAE